MTSPARTLFRLKIIDDVQKYWGREISVRTAECERDAAVAQVAARTNIEQRVRAVNLTKAACHLAVQRALAVKASTGTSPSARHKSVRVGA